MEYGKGLICTDGRVSWCFGKAKLGLVLPCSGYILKGRHATTLRGEVGVRCQSLKDICLPEGQKDTRIVL